MLYRASQYRRQKPVIEEQALEQDTVMRASHISHHGLASHREAKSLPISKNESKNLSKALGRGRLRRVRNDCCLRRYQRGAVMCGRILTLFMVVALLAAGTPVAAADNEACFEETGAIAVAACTRLIE